MASRGEKWAGGGVGLWPTSTASLKSARSGSCCARPAGPTVSPRHKGKW